MPAAMKTDARNARLKVGRKIPADQRLVASHTLSQRRNTARDVKERCPLTTLQFVQKEQMDEDQGVKSAPPKLTLPGGNAIQVLQGPGI